MSFILHPRARGVFHSGKLRPVEGCWACVLCRRKQRTPMSICPVMSRAQTSAAQWLRRPHLKGGEPQHTSIFQVRTRNFQDTQCFPVGALWGQLAGLGKWDKIADLSSDEFLTGSAGKGHKDSRMCGASLPSIGHWFQEFPEGLTSHFNMLMCGN